MTRARRAKWAALLAVATLTVASATIGVTHGAFAGETSAGANIITAMPDFRGPTVSAVIGKNTAAQSATGYIRSAATYRVYANVTDVGTPPSGTATVTANVANVTAGQTAVVLTAGAWTAGGQSYNYRSAVLTAGTLGNGNQNFTVTATDAAANVTTQGGSVTVDNVAPAPSNISAAGGIAGRPELNDVLTLTTNDTLDSFSLLANWTGAAATPVQLRIVNNATADRVQIWNSAGSAQLPFGTISLGRTDFVGATPIVFNASMARASAVITVTVGSLISGTPVTVGGTGTMTWTPSATATDRAGNAMSTAAFNEPAPADRDF